MGAAQCGPACCAEKAEADGKITALKLGARSAATPWAEQEEGLSPTVIDQPQALEHPVLDKENPQDGGSPEEALAVATADGFCQPEPGAPPHKDGEFTVVIARTRDSPIGLNLDVTDGLSLIIVEILPVGFVHDWNAANTAKCLKLDDRIIEVNGHRGNSHQMMAVLRESTEWHIVVQRPEEVQLTLRRSPSEGLGIDLRYAPNGTSLMISRLDGGPVGQWNAASKGKTVKLYDRIVEVNGTRGTAKGLLKAGMDKVEVKLAVLVYPSIS